jgi:drug/metabolite transporter (DMT)-like permease
MRYVPAYRLSLISYVTPFLALVLGASFRDEHVGVETLAGLGLILAGVSGVLSRGRPAEAPKTRPLLEDSEPSGVASGK